MFFIYRTIKMTCSSSPNKTHRKPFSFRKKKLVKNEFFYIANTTSIMCNNLNIQIKNIPVQGNGVHTTDIINKIRNNH